MIASFLKIQIYAHYQSNKIPTKWYFTYQYLGTLKYPFAKWDKYYGLKEFVCF
jgi:hypothetical protein